MSNKNVAPYFYPFYPERILWTGAAVLGVGLAVGVAFLVFWLDSSTLNFSPTSEKTKRVGNEGKFLTFSLNLKEVPITFPLPRVEPEVTFSFDPPRPDRSLLDSANNLEFGGHQIGPSLNDRSTPSKSQVLDRVRDSRHPDLFVRLKQSAQSKRVALPCRIDLRFNGSSLAFAEKESLFWLELTPLPEEKIQGVVWIETAACEKMEVEAFIGSPQASPLQGASEFAEGSPFRILGEARWMGHDVFAEKYGGKQTLRIAIGGQTNPQILDLREKEWIVWHNTCWIKGNLDENPEVAGRIESVDSKALIFEGWDGETHVRLSLPYSVPTPFKVRGEDVFNSIRVRSEKQISCMMEKQCLILRSGDWVMKANGRWKALRKKEEKEAYQSGKIGGDLFVFEKIESKQGQKLISGFLFNAEKTQVVPIDLPANSPKHPIRREAKEK